MSASATFPSKMTTCPDNIGICSIRKKYKAYVLERKNESDPAHPETKPNKTRLRLIHKASVSLTMLIRTLTWNARLQFGLALIDKTY
jgi:hypothetical protein